MAGQYRKDIRPGLRVAIVRKQDQRTGRRTVGVVKDILTSAPRHTRGIKVRLTAKAATAEAADALLATWEREVRALVDDIVFGVDDDTMESVVLDLLRSRGLSLGLAESVTGGLVAGRITSVPGASEVFRGSVVSYASEFKFDVLGVPEGPEPDGDEGACSQIRDT